MLDLGLPESGELLVADKWGHALPLSQHFKKSAAPTVDKHMGRWAGRDNRFMQLPGGATLQFDLSRLTLGDYRAMRDNYQINSSLTLLTFMLHQIDWHIECDDSAKGDAIEAILRNVWTQLIRAMTQAFWAGFSPTVVEYTNNVISMKVEISRFKDLVPEECRVNWLAVDGWVAPGIGKMPPKLYEYDGIRQMGLTDPIPVENTLWYPLLMENGDYYGRKLLKPAFPSWFFSQLIHLFANRYFERFGEPLPIGRADFDSQVEGADGTIVSGRSAMEAIVSQIRNRAVVVLPSDRDPDTKEYDFDIEYLESQMRGADFEAYLTRLDEEMSLALFTPILLLRTGQTGSFNLGVSHLQTWLWCLNALASDMKEYIDNYVVERIKAFNFGPRSPKAYWVPRSLGRDSVEVLRSIAMELVRNDVARPNLDELGDAVGMTFEEIKLVTQTTTDPVTGATTTQQVDPRTGLPPRVPAGQDTRGQRMKPGDKTQQSGGGPTNP